MNLRNYCPPYVLANEGYNFHLLEYARLYSIFVSILQAIPYPSKGDRWTDVKRDRDSAWYNWQTALALVQAYGRSVRSKDDWAYTFILDSAFDGFISRNKLPTWFTEAIINDIELQNTNNGN